MEPALALVKLIDNGQEIHRLVNMCSVLNVKVYTLLHYLAILLISFKCNSTAYVQVLFYNTTLVRVL